MSYHDALAQITEGPDDPDADALYEAEEESRRKAATDTLRAEAPSDDPLTEAVSIIQQYVEGADSGAGNPIGVHDRAVAFLQTVPARPVQCKECGERIGEDDTPDTGGHKSSCSQCVPRSWESSEMCPSCGHRMQNVSWSDRPTCANC